MSIISEYQAGQRIFTDKVVKNESFEGCDLTYATFNSCTFIDCNFSKTDLSASVIRFGGFYGCQFAGANFSDSHIYRNTIAHCNFYEAIFYCVYFSNNQIDGCNFSHAKNILVCGPDPEGQMLYVIDNIFAYSEGWKGDIDSLKQRGGWWAKLAAFLTP